MKKLLLIILLLSLTGCSQNFGADDSVSEKINIEKEILRIEKEQEKIKDGKYTGKERYEKDGIGYGIRGYFGPPYDNDSDGYQIIIYTDEYNEFIGYGIQAEKKTYKIYKTATSTQ